MTILQAHNTILDILKKTRNEMAKHSTIDNCLDLAQMDLLTSIIGNYRQYQPGRPVPPVVSGMTTRTLSDLNPFRVPQAFMAGNYNATTDPFAVTDGILVLPSDFQFFDGDSLYSVVLDNGSVRERPISILSHEEYANRSDSVIVPPTKLDPIATFDGKGGSVNGVDIGDKQRLKFKPADLSGYFVYFRRPERPNYVFTVNASTRAEAHDAATSTDLEWNEPCCYIIIKKALELLGVITEDPVVLQEVIREEMTSA